MNKERLPLPAEEVIFALGNTKVMFTPEQLDMAYALLNERRSEHSQDLVRTFHVGDAVEFDARGQLQIGTVTKRNIKTISVKTATNRWKVSASLLRHRKES